MSDERIDTPPGTTPPETSPQETSPPPRGRARFVMDVVLVRARFLALFVVVGFVAGHWDWIVAHWERWRRPAPETAAEASTEEYFCPMHPQVVRDAPGSCPICGMPLSRRKKGEAGELPAGVLARVQLTPLRIAEGGIRTAVLAPRPLVREVPTAGFVEVDERREKRIAARVAGRVDGLAVDFTGMHVAEGDSLASLYSPELITAGEALLSSARALEAIRKAGAGPEDVARAQGLLDAGRGRLLQWGLTPAQVDAVISSGKAGDHVAILSPLAGTVLEKKVTEGKYVMEGEELVRIADLTRVWVRARVFAPDLALARVGAPVEAVADAFPGETFRGTVAFTDPVLDPATRTAGVRMDIENPGGRLLPGMFVTAKLRVPVSALEPFASRKPEKGEGPGTDEGTTWTCTMHPQIVEKAPGKCPLCHMDLVRKAPEAAPGLVLAVPEPSVIDTGTRKVVYRETSPGVYDAVEVVLGPRSEGWYPVISGLASGDRVVAAGAFLVDAETRLNPAIAAAYFGASGAPAPSGHGHGK